MTALIYRTLGLLGLSTAALCTQAQRFSATPNPLTATIPASEFTQLYMGVQNHTSQTLYLRWKTIVNTLPTTWYLSLCDQDNCFPNIQAGDASPLSAGENGWFRLSVDANSLSGSGAFGILVYEISDPSSVDTFYFHVSSNAPVTILQPSLHGTHSLRVFPTPAQQHLTLHHSTLGGELLLFDAAGQVVQRESISAGNGQTTWPVTHLPSGQYLAALKSRFPELPVLVQPVLIQH
jgi:hypothetical protein